MSKYPTVGAWELFVLTRLGVRVILVGYVFLIKPPIFGCCVVKVGIQEQTP